MKKIIFIFFIILPITAYSINSEIRSLTNRDGLSNSSINIIFQDSNQLMWFGSWDGLNMYNGKEFYVYKPSSGNQQSISNNIIRDIIEEKRDYLWIATDIGINRLNVRKKTFERFFVDSLSREITDENSYLIAKDSKNNIISYVYQQGFYYFDSQNNCFNPLHLNNNLDIKKILFDKNDNLWVLTKERTIYTAKLQPQKNELIVGEIDLFPMNNIENIFHYKSGEIMIQTSDQKVYIYNDLAGIEPLILLPLKEEIGFIHDVGFDDKFVYFGTSKGLYQCDVNGNNKHLIKNTPVLNICIGSQNIIWIGTDMKGVYKIVPTNEKFKAYVSGNIPDFGNAAVRTFFEDENHILWVGTKGSGIYNFMRDQETGELKPYHRFSVKNGLISNSVYKITNGFRNEYWIGTEGNGINYYDKRSVSINRLSIPKEINLSSIYAILPDKDNVLWVGTSGYGMYKLKIDLTTNPYRVVDYKHFISNGTDSSLSNNIVYSIIKGSDTDLLIGTRGGGINLFDMQSETFKVLKLSENNFSSDDVLCLYKDNKGNLWAGTSLGLNKLSWDKNEEVSISNFSEKNGMPNNTIHGILEDENNNLWVSTNDGLTKLVPNKKAEDSYHIVSYFMNDGLQDNEFSDGSYYASPYSSLFYFGGINGFNEFNPLKITQNEFMPSLWLDAFYVDNKETDLSTFLIRENNREILTLSHKNKSFSFHFTPIDYLAASKCEIAYKLEGFHDQWVNLGTSNTIVFTNLPKGKYKFKVRSSNANKIWGDVLFSLPIEMAPPWWKSNLAYLLYTVFLFIALWFTRKLLMYRIKMNNDLKMKE